MEESFDNPFSVTRAADFTDEQIFQYWVDLADDGGFSELVKPRLEMPMLILGGKGSGKTHVMRYLSFPLQKLRHESDLISGVKGEGYLGIYMRCSGLNSARFRGKRQSDEVWADVFAYYMELWLSQMAVDVCCSVFGDDVSLSTNQASICNGIRALFDAPHEQFPDSLTGVRNHLRELQRELDVSINNCAIDGSLDVTIRTTSGKLVFGLPRVLADNINGLSDLLFVYLIDEYENLTEPQQKLINTLMRERQHPCTFKVGSRLYGVRTYSTFCADEDNKEGSEYERLPLDARLRRNESRYTSFARRLVVRRLANRGLLTSSFNSDAEIASYLARAFETPGNEGLATGETDFIKTKYAGRLRPYFKTLTRCLEKGMATNASPGVASASDISSVVDQLSCADYPLLEKLNCFIFYQRWSSRHDLVDAAKEIRAQCQEYVEGRSTKSPYHDKLLHWKADLLAQLKRECDQKQTYAGFDTLSELSWGNPRHLLILLKHVISWAGFKGEQPFGESPVSIKAQSEGVKEAADWFFRDARMTGSDGKLLQDAVGRLATLFRSIRYSHKPSECSLSTFSYEPASVSSETRRIIDLAEKWLLLVYVGDQRDRNSERVDMKFQINRMLAPKWDISFSRRGALAIPGEDLNTIFDSGAVGNFDRMLATRIARMTAPYFGATAKANEQSEQGTLFGPNDD